MRQRGAKGLGCAVSLLVLSIVALASASGARGRDWGTPVWSDEFNGVLGTPIDPAKWTYDTGILNVNNEVEHQPFAGHDDRRVRRDESECLH